MTPTTKAGLRVLGREALNSRSFALIEADDIVAIEREAREGYVPASLSPEWHAELNLTREEGRQEGRADALRDAATAVEGLRAAAETTADRLSNIQNVYHAMTHTRGWDDEPWRTRDTCEAGMCPDYRELRDALRAALEAIRALGERP